MPESLQRTGQLCRLQSTWRKRTFAIHVKVQPEQTYVDGSSYKIRASNYSGWGLWSPDEESFNDNGPLKGKQQSSDRAEVRALVAALEKSENKIEVITGNQYVRDTAQYIAAGGTVHKGKHSDLLHRIKNHIHKLEHIRWVKEHLKQETPQQLEFVSRTGSETMKQRFKQRK
eukprot:16437399-Heterocapsa_arctica.AAC.1